MLALEARRFEWFTGEQSTRNLHLYSKFGYRQFRTELISVRVALA